VHSVISHIVVAALTLHTLLGCCWHHAHAWGDEGTHEDVAHCETETPTYSCGCCHHDHDDESTDTAAAAHHDEDRDAPAPCSNSCAGKCQFVATSRVQLDNLSIAQYFSAPTSFRVVEVGGLAGNRYESRLTTVAPLPIRLHLWNQLLSI